MAPPAPVNSPKQPARRAPSFVAISFLALAVGVGLAFRHFAGLRVSTQAVPAWDRPENPREARLLATALARPVDASAQWSLGQQYQATGRPFEALWAFQRTREVIESPPAEAGGAARIDRTAILLAQADALEGGGLRARALELLEAAGSGADEDPALTVRRAALQFRLGRPSAALQSLSTFARRPSSPALLSSALLRGRVLEALGKDQDAVAAYRQSASAAPEAVEPRLRLGRLLVRLGQVREGRAALWAARQAAPTDPEPCYALGMSFMSDARAHPNPAIRWLMAATQVSPRYGPAERALGDLGVLLRYWKLAVHHYGLALTANPRDAEALVALGTALDGLGHRAEAHERRGVGYLLQGKLPQALAEFRAEKTLDPHNTAPSIFMSQTLTQMGLNAEAAVEIRAALAQHPGDADLKERLATLYILSHTGDPARRFCEQWRQEDPRAAKPLWLLGRIALPVARRLPEAIDDFEQAARLAPRDPEVLFALGEALSRSGPRHDSGRALELLARAIKLAPGEPRYRYQLGLLLQQSDQPEPARRQFLRALDLDSRLTTAYTGLIQVSGRLHETGQIALLAPVVRDLQNDQRVGMELRARIFRAPQDGASYAALARYLAGRGELREARAQWEVAAALHPSESTAARELARLDRLLAVL